MHYFETQGLDGQIYLHHDRWNQWREDRLREYPCQPGKIRFDLELCHPRDRLIDVPVQYPRTHAFFDPHTCFYECDDWSTIFGAYKYGDLWRMLVERGNREPLWGERITLFSTSSSIENEPWGSNRPNRFAFFRGQFWQVSWCQFLHEWSPHLPISNRDGRMLYERPYPEQFTDTEPAAVLLRRPNEEFPGQNFVFHWSDEDTDRAIRRYAGIAAAFTRIISAPLHEFSEWQREDEILPKTNWLAEGF